MEFKDKFKVGDIIRRGGHIRTGQLMIVEELRPPMGDISWITHSDEYLYSCQDLFITDQKWSAREDSDFTLATDEDIIKQLAYKITTNEDIDTEYGKLEADIDDEMFYLTQNEGYIMLDPIAAIKLRDVINKYVGQS